MSTAAVALASTAVRWWTRLYTSGLPATARERRREEIESDLWESLHDPEGQAGLVLATSMIGRAACGALDDLRWRATHTPRRTLAAASAAATLVLIAGLWIYAEWLGAQTLPKPPASPAWVATGPAPGPPPPPPPPPPRPR